MTTPSMGNFAYVKLERPLGVEPSVMHCPVCRAALANSYGSTQPCPHVAFIYRGEIGAFSYQSSTFQAMWDTLAIGEVDFGTLPVALSRASQGQTLLALEVAYRSVKCGSVEYTHVYGFDLKMLAH